MTVKSRPFSRLRDAHHRETGEDYVEMILELIERAGEARLTDVARRFGVSAVTAHKIVDRLQREGLVTSQPYQALLLTPQGKRLAVKSRKRHDIVYRVLCALGVPPDVAYVDAEGIEHHVSSQTLAVFQKFLRRRK